MPIPKTDVPVPEGQSHLLAFWSQLTSDERRVFSQQLASVDFDLMDELVEQQDHGMDWSSVADRAESPQAFRRGAADNALSREEAIAAGREALASGKIGVILVAGGQGSRLGFDHPKGMYPIGPLSQRTLFEMHVDQLRAVAARDGVSIPLFLMTSPATHEETAACFAAHNRFGLPESDVEVFCQGTMPAVDRETGKLLLAAPGVLFTSPDGHGGTLAALERHGCLRTAVDRGIEHLFYFQVDNPLVEICQPEFIGYHVLAKSEMSTQVVRKQDPLEKVGNVVSVDGKMTVIEYSDLPPDRATRTDADGQPIFWAGNIAVHLFDVSFLQRALADHAALPFHRAIKKVPFMDSNGELVTPETPNAIKFERFIFDLMPWAQCPIVVEVMAEEVFAPLKNASGAAKDTPETTRNAILAKSRRLMEEAGIVVADGVHVEVNPRFALDVESLRQKIAADAKIEQDQYFSPAEEG